MGHITTMVNSREIMGGITQGSNTFVANHQKWWWWHIKVCDQFRATPWTDPGNSHQKDNSCSSRTGRPALVSGVAGGHKKSKGNFPAHLVLATGGSVFYLDPQITVRPIL